MHVPANTTHEPTDRTHWRLRVDDGRQRWHYLSEEELKADPQTRIDKYWLGLPTVRSNKTSPHILHTRTMYNTCISKYSSFYA